MEGRIHQYYIEFEADASGVVRRVLSGDFAAAHFLPGNSVYDACPWLMGTLEAVDDEGAQMDGMVVVVDGAERNVDVEMRRAAEGYVVLIHDRTRVYGYIDQLNQSRNDLHFLKLEVDKLRREADRANEEKSRFLAMMSHEVRNPLNVILGYTDMIQNLPISPEVAEYVSYMVVAGRNLKVIVDDILDLSRVEAGKLELSQEPISLSNLFDQLRSSYASSHREVRIGLHFQSSEQLPQQVLGDDVRLYQILTNLINNAIKFTPSGSVTTTATLRSRDAGRAHVRFEVRDTGRGMTAAQAASVFEEYQQNELDDNRVHKGAGLGLAIVKRLVTAMEGTVQVRSEVGVGTSFIVDIPFHLPLEHSDEAPESAPAVPAGRSLEGAKVLVADDEFMNRKMVSRILERAGVDLTLVKDGLEALEALSTTAFDVVLLDINMPNLSGEALIQQREDFAGLNGQTPFLALTGNSSKSDVAHYSSLGFTGVVPKPFTREELMGTLEAALGE